MRLPTFHRVFRRDAVVGHPSRDYLWILARKPILPAEIYQSLVSRLQSQGYETSRLVRTLQRNPSEPDENSADAAKNPGQESRLGSQDGVPK